MKKLEILKSIFVVILILFLIFIFAMGVIGINRLVIFNKIYSGTDKNITFDNYTMKIDITMNDNSYASLESFYRMGKGKQVTSNGIYTWTNGEKAYMIDDESKEVRIMDMSENNEELTSVVTQTSYTAYIPGYNQSLFGKFKLALIAQIEDETLEEDCYKISYTDKENATRTYWISKNDMKIKKCEFKVGDDVILYNFDLKFFTAKITDVELGNIAEYKIVDGKTGQTVVESFSAK